MNFLPAPLKKHLGILLLLCLSSVCLADTQLHTAIINLQHRPAQQIIPLIKPLLPENSAITGENFQLMIKTTDTALQDIRAVITQLDKKLIDLIISVRYTQRTDQPLETTALVHETVISTQKHNQRDSMQQIRVQEGTEAFIEVNKSFPRNDYYFSLWGPYRETEYKDVKTGYIISSILDGNNAIVQIKYQFSRLQDGRNHSLRRDSPINIEKFETNLTASLGEWFALSQTSSHDLRKSREVLYDTNDLKQPNRNLYIKIDRAPKQLKAYVP